MFTASVSQARRLGWRRATVLCRAVVVLGVVVFRAQSQDVGQHHPVPTGFVSRLNHAVVTPLGALPAADVKAVRELVASWAAATRGSSVDQLEELLLPAFRATLSKEELLMVRYCYLRAHAEYRPKVAQVRKIEISWLTAEDGKELRRSWAEGGGVWRFLPEAKLSISYRRVPQPPSQTQSDDGALLYVSRADGRWYLLTPVPTAKVLRAFLPDAREWALMQATNALRRATDDRPVVTNAPRRVVRKEKGSTRTRH